jgi:cobalt/nickel transport system permease protein
VAAFTAAWTSVVGPALVMALVLGWQPHLAHDAQGRPSFFPFGWSVVIPALVLPHVVLGVGEGILTVLMVEAYERATGGKVS